MMREAGDLRLRCWLRAALLLSGAWIWLWTPQHAQAACNLNVQGVIFGAYDVFNVVSLDSTGNVAVNCDPSAPYSISLTPGSGTYASRAMVSGGKTLNYNLYTDAARATIWGDGTAGTVTVNGSAASANHTIYGRIPARQNAYTGSYSDLITVTLNF